MSWRGSSIRGKFHKSQPQEHTSLKATFYESGFKNGLAPATIYRYWRWVRRLILVRRPAVHPDHLSDAVVIEFIVSLQQSGLSRSSVAQAIDAICFLFRKVLNRRKKLLEELSLLRGKQGTPNMEKVKFKDFILRLVRWF